MRRLVWPFAGPTYHIVGNLMSRLNYVKYRKPLLDYQFFHFKPHAEWKFHYFQFQRAITPKTGNQELQFLRSAPHLMLVNICVKFSEDTWTVLTGDIPPSQLSCADPEGVGTPHPLKNHKNIGFLSNTGLDPLKNHKTTKPAFNVGPSLTHHLNGVSKGGLIMARFKWYFDPSQLKNPVKVGPPLKKTFWIRPWTVERWWGTSKNVWSQ